VLAKRVPQAHAALRLALEAVADWPGGFMREIDAMRDRWSGRGKQTLHRCVGAIEFWSSRPQECSGGDCKIRPSQAPSAPSRNARF
jgi:hypothetical protein